MGMTNQQQQQEEEEADGNEEENKQRDNNRQQGGKCHSCLLLYRKPLAVNLACLAFLLFYSLFGGFIFLHFEEPNWRMAKRAEMIERIQCVEETLGIGDGRRGRGRRDDADDWNGKEEEQKQVDNSRRSANEEEGKPTISSRSQLAQQIVVDCVMAQAKDERMDWNLKNAVLFGFGILTTLGYGKIEPQTTEGRLFTVFYGFIGVPFTVIIFTNFGRYLQKLERFVRKRFWHKWRRKITRKSSSRKESLAIQQQQRKGSCILPPITVQMDEEEMEEDGNGEEDEEEEEEEGEDQISPLTLICIVFLYLLLGAALIDWLDVHVDFLNGIYFSFLCLTAIEYGKLIPTDAAYLPLVIAYICFGLAISTIALDIGSTYVKKLYYLGRKIRNIASIKIWFGAKHLRVRELLAALGHNIGLEPTVLCDLDLEQLISNAIQVKEGRLHRVPQTHMIMDGIWPPELVPLFLKDGQFPDWVDAEERRKWSTASLLFSRKRSFRGSARSGILSVKQKLSNESASLRSALLSNQPPERSPPLPPLLPEKLSVRFEEFVRSSDEGKWPSLMDTSTSGIASADLSMTTTGGDHHHFMAPPPSSRWSLLSPIDDDENTRSQLMRRSETVPPATHPDTSLLYLCNFPSLEIRHERPPLPPLAPLPDEDEVEKEKEVEEEEEEDGKE